MFLKIKSVGGGGVAAGGGGALSHTLGGCGSSVDFPFPKAFWEGACKASARAFILRTDSDTVTELKMGTVYHSAHTQMTEMCMRPCRLQLDTTPLTPMPKGLSCSVSSSGKPPARPQHPSWSRHTSPAPPLAAAASLSCGHVSLLTTPAWGTMGDPDHSGSVSSSQRSRILDRSRPILPSSETLLELVLEFERPKGWFSFSSKHSPDHSSLPWERSPNSSACPGNSQDQSPGGMH